VLTADTQDEVQGQPTLPQPFGPSMATFGSSEPTSVGYPTYVRPPVASSLYAPSIPDINMGYQGSMSPEDASQSFESSSFCSTTTSGSSRSTLEPLDIDSYHAISPFMATKTLWEPENVGMTVSPRDLGRVGSVSPPLFSSPSPDGEFMHVVKEESCDPASASEGEDHNNYTLVKPRRNLPSSAPPSASALSDTNQAPKNRRRRQPSRRQPSQTPSGVISIRPKRQSTIEATPPPPPPLSNFAIDASRHVETIVRARSAQDQFLLTAKAAGMTYREIRAQGDFAEAESTLRGRYRALTKSKECRVRKPEWLAHDVSVFTPNMCQGFIQLIEIYS
jgi:hypothetical protein